MMIQELVEIDVDREAPQKKDALAAAENGVNPKTIVGGDGWVTDSYLGLTARQVEESRSIFGANEIPKHVTPTYMLFVKQFFGFMPVLIALTALISFSLQDYADFLIIFSMLIINALIGFREEYHAKKCLEELSNTLENTVTIIRDGSSSVLPVSEVVPGDIVVLLGGTMIPADVKWIRGDTMKIDTASLTGEPLPRKYPGEHGDVMLSGTTVCEGECYSQVVAIGTQTEMGAAQADVMNDKSVAVVSLFQKKITLVVQCTISFSLVLVIAAVLVQGIAKGQFAAGNVKQVILEGLSILIPAIPIALPLVMQVNMALGASFLAKQHSAIVTSLPAIQDLASMSVLCSDKTGTLTTAKMTVITEKIVSTQGYTQAQVLMYAFLAANKDKKDDPIDRAIVSAFSGNSEAQATLQRGKYRQESLVGFNPEVKRVVAFVSCDAGKETIAKGLVAKVLDTHAGGEDSAELQWQVRELSDRKFIQNLHEQDRELSKAGYKTIAIAMCNDDAREATDPEFRFVGLVPMLDPPREDTADTIRALHEANISVKMITGDHCNVGRETAKLIGLGTDIQPGEAIRTANNEQIRKEMIWEADGFAAVLPSDKREVVMTLRNDFGVVTGMTGDGVNDAAALSAAQVGIAVEGSTDAAKNAADLILTKSGLSPIYGAVYEARRIFARVKSYVIYRVAASLAIVLILSILVFVSGCAVDPLYMIVLTLLNDVSMIPVAYDNAEATRRPQLPRSRNLVMLSTFFAVLQTSLAMILFYAIADNGGIDGFALEGPGACNGSTKGFIWLHLAMCTEFMIFSARAPTFFWKSRPSLTLVLAVLITVGPVCCVIAAYVDIFEVPPASIGYLWLYNAVIFVVIDLLKAWFKELIGDRNGEVIKDGGDGGGGGPRTTNGEGGDSDIGAVQHDGDDDEGPAAASEAKRHLLKAMRYQVHRESMLSGMESLRSIVIRPAGGFRRWFRPPSFTDGFVRVPDFVRNPMGVWG